MCRAKCIRSVADQRCEVNVISSKTYSFSNPESALYDLVHNITI
jgi:hypothetical protein